MSIERDIPRIMVGILMYLRDVEAEKQENVFSEESIIPKDVQDRCFSNLKGLGFIDNYNDFLELTDSGRQFIIESMRKEMNMLLESKT